MLINTPYTTPIHILYYIIPTGSDGWAVDNIQILRKFPSNWSILTQFKANIQYTYNIIQQLQCCYDTDWCKIRLTTNSNSNSNKQQCISLLSSLSTVPASPSPAYSNIYTSNIYYNIRLEEIFILITIVINILKFIYITITIYYIQSRLPFQDEFEYIVLHISYITYLLPPRYRPKRTLHTQADESHYLARIADTINNNNNNTTNNTTNTHNNTSTTGNNNNSIYNIELNDTEGEGERIKRKEEIKRKKQRRQHKKQKLIKKKLKKQLEQHQMKNNKLYKGKEITAIHELTDDLYTYGDSGDDNDSNGSAADGDGGANEEVKRGGGGDEDTIDKEMRLLGQHDDKLMSDMDRLRRENIQLTRTPFTHRISYTWRYVFATITLGVFTVALLYRASTTTSYIVNFTLTPYNVTPQQVGFTSLGLNLFAVVSDFKEVYYAIKHIVPLVPPPLLTIDSSEGVHSMFVGQHTIPLVNISNISTFTYINGYLYAIAVLFGCFPICLFSLILRDSVLDYSSMRIVVPILGSLMIYRAILGPAYVIKIIRGLSFLFAYTMETRVQLGKALQTRRAKNSALVAAFILCLIATIGTASIYSTVVGQAFGIALLGGLLYGAATGASHDLPIRPWLYLTTLDGRGGVAIHLQRKQKCPCVVW